MIHRLQAFAFNILFIIAGDGIDAIHSTRRFFRAPLQKSMNFWFRPVDVINLRWFEGVLMFSVIYYFASYLKTPAYWLSEKGHHVSPEATLSHYIPPPVLVPESWLPFVTVAFFTFSSLYMFGYFRRYLVWLFLAVAVYVQAMDQPSSFTINRMFIISFFVLALQSPTFIRDGKQMIAGWVPRFFQLTLFVQYSTAGVCKMVSGDWLAFGRGDWLYSLNLVMPDIVWTQSQGHYKNYISAYAVNYLPWPIWWTLAMSTMIFETGFPFLFIWKRLRIPTLVFGVVFHLGIAILMKDLIYFSLQMITAYVLFLPPQYLYDFKRWLKGKWFSASS
ncbi:MAG: hypothetical protein VX278_20135 [Myxococcota bacterium]|nr:hypothetical protein [Myxococcota bacterium]